MKVGDLVVIMQGPHKGRAGLIVLHKLKNPAWSTEMYDVLVGSEKCVYTGYELVSYSRFLNVIGEVINENR
tara:strand:- start:202 stop:414 length:213 start_codon:yes stop_codon:yes gene_type:complete